MSLTLIVLLPFIGAVLPAIMIRAGRNACATATGSVTLLALILLMAKAPAVIAGEVFQVLCVPAVVPGGHGRYRSFR